ncbi:MAG: sigma-70 family RNA polymerase sigma factor [Ferruginibacter sp.]
MNVSRKFSDEELINSLQQERNSNDAIRFMYDHYFESLSRFVMNNQGSLQDAEDIFQELVINFIALVKLNKFRGESSIKTFLFSLNRFSWLNELKRRGRASARELSYEKGMDTVEKDFSHVALQKESTEQVYALMNELGETCKKILLMFYYEDLSMKEMLQQLNYENEQIVRNKKYKCLKQLEKMISDKPSLKQTLKNLLNG